MSVHITKTYNIGGLIGLRQNAVKNAGETLGFKEMSLFKFPDAYDSDDELHVRMDGIIASLCPEDIVIFQHPSGESPRYDGFLFEHLRRYHGTKIVAFIQEIAFDRDDSEYSLSDEITLLNRADMFIFASAALRDYYIANGLKEKPYLIQNIPDYMTDICANENKNKKLYIMAETSQNEYPLNNLNIEVVQYDEYRAMLNSATSRYFKARMGQYLYTGDVQYFLAHEVRNYYPNPYGEKFNPAKLAVSDSFTGRVACDGNYNLVLDGEFGEDFSQIAYWRYNIPVFEGQCIDMYLEYEKTGDVEIKLRLFQFYYGSIGDIKQVWEFDEEQLQDVFRIDNESDQGPVFVSILARGTGSLNIISLHDRHSRRGHGFFLPGGERLVSSKGEEVFVYFEKGDMKPPLAVYFSGYRTQEGFEGYYMMRGFGCPFILVTDPRSEGGAFYLGDSEFEQMITDYVTDKLDELGLTKDELVLSGASMGTFGSLYYGSKLSPHALLLAKPLANMGNVARNERILRAGGFATSLDILMKNYDNLSDEAIEQLNNRMWDRFDSADWSQTKFIISYLYEDDYDPDGYPSILSHLKSSGVEVYGKGSHGRHTDNSSNVMAWFKSQYNNLLHDDFSR